MYQKHFHTRQAAMALLKMAKSTTDPDLAAKLVDVAADLAGQWLVYGIRTPAAVPGASAEARGALAFDATGALAAAASLKTLGGDSVGGIDELTSGGLTVSSAGIVQGSLSDRTRSKASHKTCTGKATFMVEHG